MTKKDDIKRCLPTNENNSVWWLSWREFMRSLPPLQQKIILIIYENPSVDVSRIAKYCFVSFQTASAVLGPLKRMKLVESVVSSGDKRLRRYNIKNKMLIEYLDMNNRCRVEQP